MSTLEESHCSDLFITVGLKPTVRRHGGIEGLDQEAVSQAEMDHFLATALSQKQRDRFESLGDLDAGYSMRDSKR